jgi:site-specific recombinase XerD
MTSPLASGIDWQAFMEICRRAGIKDKALRWYIVRVERYLRAHPGRAPDDHECGDVQDYLERAGRESRLPAWLFRQLVHALQLFFCEVVRAQWAATFDWRYWLDAARELEPDHPTLAVHHQPIASAVLKHDGDQQPFSLPLLEQQLAARIRLKNYSIRTEEAYVSWVSRYVRFHDGRDPRTLDNAAIAAYLNHLALDRNVTPSTQGQALSALVFLYEQVLDREVGSIAGLVAAKKPRRLPTVLTREEVRRVLACVQDQSFALIVGLLYGTGMRLLECVRLRIKEVDFGYSQITVRDGKGQKDRVVPLPQRCKQALEEQIRFVTKLHGDDQALGYGFHSRCAGAQVTQRSQGDRLAVSVSVREAVG